MKLIVLAVVLGTLPIAFMLWRELVRERLVWQREQAQRQERLMREDIVDWTDRVARALATTGESWELDRVRPLPKPTLWHRGEHALPWLMVVGLWLIAVMFFWLMMI